MGKAASPIRLQAELMASAKLVGQRMHRSASEQIEYWASLGRSVSDTLDPDVLLSISSGMATIKVEPRQSPTLDPEQVFARLEQARSTHQLSQQVTSVYPRYQASLSHPGLLEQIDAQGHITVGQFANGVFTPHGE